MTIARFKVPWRFDGTIGATVTVNRGALTVSVRPLRRHRTYELPLAEVAQIICERIMKAEAVQKRLAKRARRLLRVA